MIFTLKYTIVLFTAALFTNLEVKRNSFVYFVHFSLSAQNICTFLEEMKLNEKTAPRSNYGTSLVLINRCVYLHTRTRALTFTLTHTVVLIKYYLDVVYWTDESLDLLWLFRLFFTSNTLAKYRPQTIDDTVREKRTLKHFKCPLNQLKPNYLHTLNATNFCKILILIKTIKCIQIPHGIHTYISIY